MRVGARSRMHLERRSRGVDRYGSAEYAAGTSPGRSRPEPPRPAVGDELRQQLAGRAPSPRAPIERAGQLLRCDRRLPRVFFATTCGAGRMLGRLEARSGHTSRQALERSRTATQLTKRLAAAQSAIDEDDRRRARWSRPRPAALPCVTQVPIRNSVSRRFSVSPWTSATTSTWSSSGVPRSLVASRSSTWKMPAELLSAISIRTARSLAALDLDLVDRRGGERVDALAAGLDRRSVSGPGPCRARRRRGRRRPRACRARRGGGGR